MSYMRDIKEEYDFRDIELMTEAPVVIRAIDETDNEEYFVLEVTDIDGSEANVALTQESLMDLYCEIMDIVKEKEESN